LSTSTVHSPSGVFAQVLPLELVLDLLALAKKCEGKSFTGPELSSVSVDVQGSAGRSSSNNCFLELRDANAFAEW